MDITPEFTVLPAAEEVVFPPTTADVGPQTVGGFMQSPNGLTNGQLTLNATNEQILIGAATDPVTGIGIFMGNDGQLSPGYDFRVGDPSGHYIWWDASAGTLSIVGAVSATSINIPDTTTANSFHTDSLGNSWWGANVASGMAAAKASIDNQGNAIFKSVSIGGAAVQYVITNSGIFSYGDGSDGSATITADATLTSDKYYTDLTINNAATLNPGGYRIFVSGTLTLGGATAGTIARNGNNGTTATNANGTSTTSTPGTGGAGLSDGYLKGAPAGGNGGQGGGGSAGNGVAGTGASGDTNTSNSIGSNGALGGGGGGSGGGGLGTGGGSLGAGGGGGGGGTATTANVKLIANWHLATLLDITSSGSTIKYDNSASSGGGGGGGSGGGTNVGTFANSGNSGSGGGAGSGGGIVAIYARNIVINANGAIHANGGNGGNGGNAGNANGTGFTAGGSGGGGGGAGGNGGQVIMTYNQLSGAGIANITANGGTGGTGGSGGTGFGGQPSGGSGANGAAGTAGNVRQFQLSL